MLVLPAADHVLTIMVPGLGRGEIKTRVARLGACEGIPVQRVCVIGTSGAGKSTLGRALARSLGAPFCELDSVFHQADWVPLPAEEFRGRVGAVVAGERWVIDGNYSAVRPIVWARADTVVWLDLPKRTVMRRIIWRSFRRVAGRVELWNGNRERWRNLFAWDPEESVISWAWHKHADHRELFAAAMADPANGHLQFVRLTSTAAVREFLRTASGGH
jgi:adenylate kinase family enzyme